MEWTHLTPEQYSTTRWSGGSTTQLAISPAGADYAQRDFLWRLSSAKVELDHSEFTPLPDYDRLLSTLEGGMQLKIGDKPLFTLEPQMVCAFDGGTPVESWGLCTDFNLMLRKDRCQGTVQALRMQPGCAVGVTTPLPSTAQYPNGMLAVYCVSGGVTLPEVGMKADAGELLLCQAPDLAPVLLESEQGCTLMVASIRGRE